ncbi:hypothetical protein BJ138DRAFT_1124266 [Hygrophoropsis aurantiaca]|uniref:Uncharacterized protein n=1 Tax=Hygrophoropsis aurantiaca TaxID=72124 RepID=A0ACB8AKX3_9AGAM|nr:hypothetical protein BJ138DRAFT_1124266 [Hygrophoropsis aurantiaca]
MATLQDLPHEILCRIIIHIPVKCIIHLRQLFHQLTYDRSIWIEIYRFSAYEMILPKGPFACQTTRYLERNLVQSVQPLTRNWPPNRDASPAHLRVIPHDISHPYRYKCLVRGRWLLVIENLPDFERIRYYDLDHDEQNGESPTITSDPHSILYESPAESFIDVFKCTSTFDNGKEELECEISLAFIIWAEIDRVGGEV